MSTTFATGPMRYLALLLFSLVLTVPGISRIPPLDRDESRYVQSTKQMLESGDYIDIRMQDTPRYKKPIGIYWAQAALARLSGEGSSAPIWIYRLTSVLATVLSVLAVCWSGTRLFGPAAGFIAGLVLASIFGIALEGRIAKTDALLVALTTVAQGALAQIWRAARGHERPGAHLANVFWAAQGLAILVKGPVVPLVSALTVAALFAIYRDLRWLTELKVGRGLLLIAVVVAPWLAAITWKSGGAFWTESIGRDLLGKVAQGQESHSAPPGYFAIVYALFFWPFGLLALAAALRAWNLARSDPRLGFMLAWYLPLWALLELIATKLPHYILPAYPALALMAGWAAVSLRSAAEPPLAIWQGWLLRLTLVGHFVVSVGLAAVLVAAPLYLGGGLSPVSIAAVAVLATGYLGLSCGLSPTRGKIALTGASAALTYMLAYMVVLPSLGSLWLSPSVAAAVAALRPCADSVLASAGFHEPSLVFLVGTDTVLTTAEGAAAHLVADPRCALALISQTADPPFLDAVRTNGYAAEPLTEIEGVNYSTGEHLRLTLYRLAPSLP